MAKLKIIEVQVHLVSRPARSPFTTARQLAVGQTDVPVRTHVLVEIRTDGGWTGFGEGATDPLWPQGMTPAELARLIMDTVVPVLRGRDPADLERLIPDLERAAGNPFAVAAADMALWDVVGRARGQSVVALLGGAARARMPLHLPIGIKSPDEVTEDVRQAVEAGYQDFKLKVGGPDADAEAASVAAVRATAGPEARIRLDANQAWTPAEAVRRLHGLKRHGIRLVEQPVVAEDLAGMREVRRATGIPVMADESCFDARDVARLAEAEAADAVNIKLMKCGGLWRAREVAAAAAAAGLEGFMGSMLEMEIGASASLQFALSQAMVIHPTGILHPTTARPLADPPWRTDGPFAVLAPTVHGLGAEPRFEPGDRVMADGLERPAEPS